MNLESINVSHPVIIMANLTDVVILQKGKYSWGEIISPEKKKKLFAPTHLRMLEDKCSWTGAHSCHQYYSFATVVPIQMGFIIKDIRDVTAIEWYELMENKSEFGWKISDSLMTPEFIEYMRQNYPEVNCGRPLVMTGKQFKEYYPGVYVRLFVEGKNHNGHIWKEGLNKCENFDPSIECGNGLYFVHERHRDLWLQYNKKVMYWWSYVIIPDYTTVAVIEDPCDEDNIKFNAEDLEIVEFIKL